MVAYTFADPAPPPPINPDNSFTSAPVPNAGFVTDPAEPDAATRFHSAWWTYAGVPTDGVLKIYSGNSTAFCFPTIWSGTTLGNIVRIDGTVDSGTVEAIVHAGDSIYVRLATPDDSDIGDYVLAGWFEPGTFVPAANDNFADAALVDMGGSQFLSPPVRSRLLGTEPDEPWYGFNSAWWSYTPLTSGTATISTLDSVGVNTILYVATGTDLASLSMVAQDDYGGGDPQGRALIPDLPVDGGTTYYIRIASNNYVPDGQYVLGVDGPDTRAFDGRITAPPANVVVEAPPPAEWSNPILDIPPAEAIVEALAPDLIEATITLVAPADGLIQPSKTPVFTVDVATDDRNVTLEVEVGVDTSFVGAVSFTAPVPRGLLSNRINVQLDPTRMALENDNTYYWHARVSNAWDSTEWTGPQQFVVSAIDGDAVVAGGWTVDTTVVPRPHLWFSNPSAAKPGEASILYGSALRTPLTMTIAGAVADVVSVQQVPAAPEAYTGTRTISAGHISSAHSKILFVIPDVPGPGGVLYVDTH